MAAEILKKSEVASNIDLLSTWIESRMAYSNQPGLSIAVVCDQELAWPRGFGFANAEQKIAASPQTIYRIASITKLFTSTALLQLRDADRLQLDDPITQHLPWFEIKQRFTDAPPITIRHLITHTSGLPREAAFPYWSSGEFPSRDQVRAGLSEQETILPTETAWKYSNLALSLAGEVVAAASGRDYAEYVETQILKPLGMDSTYVSTIEPDHPQLAAPYGRKLPDGNRTTCPFTDGQGITPAANMATSAEDLARFAMLQFRDGPATGAQILKGSTLREMQRVHWLDPNWQMGWGLGFQLSRIGDKTYIGHGGAVRGYRTALRACPADKTAVIVLTNSDDGMPADYVDKCYQWLVPALVKAIAPAPARPTLDPAWKQYAGKYRNDWGDAQVLELNGDLVMIDPTLEDPTSAVGKLIPAGEHTFVLEVESGFDLPGEEIVFELDKAGKVLRLKTGQNYMYPVEAW
jgi:CubicO group peptidase (beta-lactamase class C family)